jgi:hypothetical protein
VSVSKTALARRGRQAHAMRGATELPSSPMEMRSSRQNRQVRVVEPKVGGREYIDDPRFVRARLDEVHEQLQQKGRSR